MAWSVFFKSQIDEIIRIFFFLISGPKLCLPLLLLTIYTSQYKAQARRLKDVLTGGSGPYNGACCDSGKRN